MAGKWYTATVTELQRDGILLVEDGNHGEYRPRPGEFVKSGVAFIRAADMDGGRVLFQSAARINERARQRITKGIGAPGDLLLSHKGTVGKVALVPNNAPAFVCSPQTTFWRTRDERRLDRKYLYSFLRSPAFHAQLATRAGETDMAPYVSLTSQRGLFVTLPPIQEQRAIAHILGTLDDKIELNRRMNETLEAMARAFFKSWFVDFDPVRAKMAGRDPGLPQSLADLFPARLVDSELGEIPEGWAIQPIGDLADVVGGTTPSTKEPSYWEGGEHAWVTPKDLSGLSVPVLLDTERRITDAGLSQVGSGLLPKGTVLLSSRAPIGYLAVAELPVAINQGFIAMVAKAGKSNLFLLLWASVAHEDIVSRANGSTFLEISKANFRPIPVVTPSAQVMLAFEKHARCLYDRIVESARESRSLAKVRDSLLPRLISGELQLTVMKRTIEAV
ncbi:MAG: restriction endonuclease subunit S [Casimicrobiaceae bacterium]